MLRKLKNIYHFFEALLANIVYGFPSRSLTVIGVTGTDGKTTTSHLIYTILRTAGKKVALTSSIYADVAGDVSDTGLHVTTQSRWQIQKNLRKAVKNGYSHFVVETTSHGLDQMRVWGIRFKVGIITNVTHEHLDYHQTYEKYLLAKAKLLKMSQVRIINKDDMSFPYLEKYLNEHKLEYKTFSLTQKADMNWIKKIQTSLQEDFNRENILAAYLASRELGIEEKYILKGIKEFSLPKGRFDRVYNEDFQVIIDFAHTPNSISKILQLLKSQSSGKIIHVFGAAGLRDYKKRPEMGRTSALYSDVIVITEEDYRTETFDSISQKIEEGMLEKGFSLAKDVSKPKRKEYVIIEDRQEAIDYAIGIAKKGDVVVCTGKGHEKSLARGKKEVQWNEYRAVRKALIKKAHDVEVGVKQLS